MKIIHFTYVAVLAVFFASCTTVTSTNIPGKKEKSFPKKLKGEYELQYPSSLSFLGDAGASTITFTSNSMKMNTNGEETTTQLGDSLYISLVGKNYYLSMGEAPSFSVFQLKPNGKDWELRTMNSLQESLLVSDLENYFSNVKETSSPSEDGMNYYSYEVTIRDNKLEDFFKSSIPMDEPFILKKK